MIPENSSPAIIAPPRPLQSGSERVIGIKPTTVEIVLNNIGSTREPEASMMACFKRRIKKTLLGFLAMRCNYI